MRVKKTKSKNFEHYSIIYDVNINGKRTSKIYENIGNYDDLIKKSNGEDPMLWLKNYVNELNNKIKNNSLPIILKKYPNQKIQKNKKISFNAGYIFLQKIYYSLGINDICKEISNKYQFKYNLNEILSYLIFARIIYPSSKLKTMELCKNFVEQPSFEYQHIIRALEVISKENDFIQSKLYKNSLTYSKRNDKILYYDCTNYYFEIENDDDYRKYGKSKENRPNPIVGMGLFLDGDGIPLAFSTFSGSTNEQVTLKPLEEKIIKDFNNSEFVVCTDAGLASTSNRKFNNKGNRKFVTTQSIKKLKLFLKDYALDLTKDWKILGVENKTFNISSIRNNEELIKKYYDKFFYKERWIKEDGLEQRLIVTFSPKYQEYQRHIREKQINRAKTLIENNPKNLKTSNENDPKRFIENNKTTDSGEVAVNNNYSLNQNKINEEAAYDGLYAVCTNLEDDVSEIIKVNKQRWEIEESFKIMKSEFKARPVYLSRQDRINAHFITCFLSLVIYRYLEKKLGEKYTVSKIVETLKNYNFINENNVGYSPLYTLNEITNDLHEKFDIDTSFEIISNINFKKIINQTKK